MKIETSRKFLDCTIIAYSFLRNGYNYCLANVFRKMEIAYKNGTAFREIPMKEEYGLHRVFSKAVQPSMKVVVEVYINDFFLAVEYANKMVRQIKEWCFF